MAIRMTRRSFVAAAGAASLALLGGCSSGAGSSASESPSGDAGQSAGGAPRIVVGTLATEDILPLWVAQDQGLFADYDLEVDIVQFQSATELIAGVGSGEVDLAMTDIMVAASMFASGIEVQMEWVTLGTEPEQGRFGIMVGPESDVQSLEQLAGVPIGVGTNTILEYVMDCLMEQAGVPADQVVVEEIQKLPVRYQAMASGEVAAAALPGSLLALGEANGCRVIADDTTGQNISQSVMVAREAFLGESSADEAIETLKSVWNEAATSINENPEDFRATLVQNANLSDEVAQTYPISEYPQCELPSEAMVDPVLAWMDERGYLTQPVSYDEQTGRFALA